MCFITSIISLYAYVTVSFKYGMLLIFKIIFICVYFLYSLCWIFGKKWYSYKISLVDKIPH